MTITITAPGEYISDSPDAPVVGRRYALEDATSGTGAQNRAFHALISEYWVSGAHSYPAKTYEDFRNQIKRKLGAGFEAFVYVDPLDNPPVIHDALKYSDVPAHVRADADYRKLIRGRLKSFSDYTKTERRDTLNRLIAEMVAAGVQSKRFREIIDGMEASK